MTDYDRLIIEGKQIITDYIQKKLPDYAKRITALRWAQDTEDWEKDINDGS